MADSILELSGVETAYGLSQVLFGVSLTIAPGEMVTLMGRNGMGKTTSIRTLFGILAPTAGRVIIAGRDMTRAAPHARARAGLGLESLHRIDEVSVEEFRVPVDVRQGARDDVLPGTVDR